jgi:L-amino acid N-acyltransferase YncA
MHGLEKDIQMFHRPVFAYVREKGALIGGIVFNSKDIALHRETIPSFYICLFAVLAEKSGQGFGTLLLREVTRFLLMQKERCLMYGYIEKENIPSIKAFGKVGFQSMGNFVVSAFGTIRPRIQDNVLQLEQDDEPKISALLEDHYQTHTLRDWKASIIRHEYYVIKINNEILAGLQVKQFTWSFIQLPGLSGAFILKVLPKVPVLRRLFNPKKYRFLKIGNIFYRSGRENYVLSIIRHLLAQHRLTICMAYLDPASPVQDKIIGQMKRGILSTVDSGAAVWALPKGLSEDELRCIKKKSLHISILDSI